MGFENFKERDALGEYFGSIKRVTENVESFESSGVCRMIHA